MPVPLLGFGGLDDTCCRKQERGIEARVLLLAHQLLARARALNLLGNPMSILLFFGSTHILNFSYWQ